MNWKAREHQEPERISNAVSPSFPPLISRILSARGVLDAEQFLNPSLRDLRDPLSLDGMSVAIDRLVYAHKHGEKVAVYADFDLDGTSGLALLYDALVGFGFQNVVYYQPLRLSEGYGLHASAVEKLAQDGVRVIVSVDVGITAFEAGERAKALDVDLIITDHHLPKEKLPPAYAIVNPNKGDCGSELGHLSGSGVAFYLVLALKRRLEKEGHSFPGFDTKKLLDCFVIGTLTDMVPLKEENRVLIRHGLLQLQKTQRPALKHLMIKLGLFGRQLSSQDVAISLAPKLNALSRMEADLKPRDVFMIKGESEAQAIVDTILENNEMRKYLQKEALEQAREMAAQKVNPTGLFLYSKDFHKGVIGLIATQLSQDYGVPAFIGSLDDEGFIHGSARVPEGVDVHLVETLQSLSQHLVRSGGHSQAAGFVLKTSEAETFEKGLQSRLISPRKIGVMTYDSEARLDEINENFMSWYSNLEPFGKEFPPVLLKIDEAELVEQKPLKGGHMRLKLRQGRTTHEAIAFKLKADWDELTVGRKVQALIEPQWNHFRGEKRLQLLVKALKL